MLHRPVEPAPKSGHFVAYSITSFASASSLALPNGADLYSGSGANGCKSPMGKPYSQDLRERVMRRSMQERVSVRRRACFWSAYPTVQGRWPSANDRATRRVSPADASRSSRLTTKPFAPAWRLIRMRRSRSCICLRTMQGQGQHRLPVDRLKFSNSRSKKSLRAPTGSAGCRRGPRSVACDQPD